MRAESESAPQLSCESTDPGEAGQSLVVPAWLCFRVGRSRKLSRSGPRENNASCPRVNQGGLLREANTPNSRKFDSIARVHNCLNRRNRSKNGKVVRLKRMRCAAVIVF